MFRVDTIRTEERITAFRSEWLNLFQRSEAATPFQHPDWVLPWWRIFGSGRLCLLSVRRGGDLIGLAPLYVHERCARILGSGNSDYLDFLYTAQYREDTIALLLEATALEPWDWCDFFDLPEHSALSTAALPNGLRREIRPSSACPVLRVERSAPGGRMRRNLRARRTRLEAQGAVRFEVHEEHAPEILEHLFALHAARWERRGEQGVLADDRVRAFHREVAAGFGEAGMLRLHSLQLDRRVVSVWYCFAAKRRVYCYIPGFDPSLSEYGPGAMLLEDVVRHARSAGDLECDFLRGQERYKYDWGAEDRHNSRLLITRS